MAYNILFITPWFPSSPLDGKYNYILHGIEALVRSGNKVSVLVTQPWMPNFFGLMHPAWKRPQLQVDDFDPALNIHLRQYFSIPRYYLHQFSGQLHQFSVAGSIRQLIRAHDIQLIHAHTEQAGFSAASIAKEFKIPSVLTLHGIDTSPHALNTVAKQWHLRNILCGADRVVLVGKPLHAYFASIAGCDDHFRVVPNGFYLPAHLLSSTRKSCDQLLRVISVSNLQEGKGIDLAIKALHHLTISGYNGWTYTIVGDGPELDPLKNIVENLGLTERVFFKGWLHHDQALQLLAEADIFLLPSYREAFGVAYLEAMAMGLLTIGVQGQGPEAFISHGETGYLVPPQDTEAIFRVLRSAIEDWDNALRISAMGREHARNNFTWEKYAEKLKMVYSEVV